MHRPTEITQTGGKRTSSEEQCTHEDEDGLLRLVEQLRNSPHVVMTIDVPAVVVVVVD